MSIYIVKNSSGVLLVTKNANNAIGKVAKELGVKSVAKKQARAIKASIMKKAEKPVTYTFAAVDGEIKHSTSGSKNVSIQVWTPEARKAFTDELVIA